MWRLRAFLVKRLNDFFGGEVVRFKKRGCVILCMESLHDFYVWRGCVIFLTHSLTQVVERLRDFLCEEVA